MSDSGCFKVFLCVCGVLRNVSCVECFLAYCGVLRSGEECFGLFLGVAECFFVLRSVF